MASHLKVVFVTCLLLLILLEEFKPVLAKGKQQLKQRTKILETGVADLKAKIKSLEDCNACSKLKDLNDTLNELRKKIDNKTKLADCGDPGFPVHGSKTGNDYKAGGTVNFACDTGYHLEGPTNLLCLKNGTWDNTIPKCHRLCKEPAPLKNGHKTGSEFWEGKTVTYKCDNGYKLQGPTARVCNSNGDWTGEEPTCEPEVASAAAGLEDSEILKGDPSHLKKIGDFLKPVVQSNTHWKRCWRASQDGWAAKTFHVQCDGESPTVTIVRVGKYIFGGFTSEYWWASGGCAYHEDSKAFLFTLVNAPGQPALKLEQRKILTDNGKKAMFSCWIYGPTFGGEMWGDLYIADYAGWNKKSWTGLKWYGYGYGYRGSYLLGDYLLGHFTPDEVEVFYGTT